jgi:2-keto-3-deoxy-L-rhamnonate aldolase RhmA
LDTLISDHDILDVAKVKSQIKKAELLVRLNPLHENSSVEIECAISAGADFLVQPMIRHSEEVEAFCELVAGRTSVIPLIETKSAIDSIDKIVSINGVSEIYIGLNDLYMDMKLNFIFEPLALGIVDRAVEKINASGLRFGFGGIARVGEGVIPGEMVLGEHYRLGSDSVILSRTFHRKSKGISDLVAKLDLASEIKKLTAAGEDLSNRSAERIEQDHQFFLSSIAKVSSQRR